MYLIQFAGCNESHVTEIYCTFRFFSVSITVDVTAAVTTLKKRKNI